VQEEKNNNRRCSIGKKQASEELNGGNVRRASHKLPGRGATRLHKIGKHTHDKTSPTTPPKQKN
jgi:hypothetical protein